MAKNIKTPTGLLLGFLVCLVLIFSKQKVKAFQNTNTSSLSVQVVSDGPNKIAFVSFQGKQGHLGQLKIYNAQHVLLKTCSIELIALPYHASVDINPLTANQSYQFELTTDDGLTETITLSL